MSDTPTYYSADHQDLPPFSCPWCGHGLNAVGQAQSAVCELPEAGDTTVCIQCIQASIFLADGQLRRARPDELDEEIRRIQEDIRRMWVRLN